MPSRGMSICKAPGCSNKIRIPGYCPMHEYRKKIDVRDRFKSLDDAKTEETKRFYRGNQWTQASRRHRIVEPLCRRCGHEGMVQIGELVHHNPPLEDLLRDGKNPYDHRHLETLCFCCHQKELSKKTKSLETSRIP